MSKYTTLKDQLRGPVYPVCPAFTANGEFDVEATGNYIDFLLSKEVKVVMVTAGTSRFNLLSIDEVKQLNEVVVSRCKGKAITIAANQMIGSTKDAIDFTQHAEGIGADIILIYYPERYYGDDKVYDYFATIADSTDIGVMIHANPMRRAAASPNPNVNYSVDLCTRLTRLENMVGMKEEHGNSVHTYNLATNLSNEMAFIVAGGSMRLYLSCVLYGVQGFLVGVGNFIPQIEEDFYQLAIKGDYQGALKIVKEVEEPFFTAAMPMGWHIAMKGALNILGLMPNHERAPLAPADSAEMESLKEALQTMSGHTAYMNEFDLG